MAAKCEWILADGEESKLDPKMVAKFGEFITDIKASK